MAGTKAMKKRKALKRVLIVNRGEIAVRIIRALRELQIESVALYSDEDVNSPHIELADYCYHLAGRTATDTYLNCEKIIEAIKETESDGVHPGYGFLAENSEFCKMVDKETKAKFIGPSAHAMEVMGNKVTAKTLLAKNKIPLVPGCEGALTSFLELEKVAGDIGYPLILKASAGGGGKGMRIVREESELLPSYESCKREALNYFKNDEVFCERYVENPRHIEVQVLCDAYGKGVHLFERECTIQRRHQKLLEEAPSLAITEKQRKKLGELSLKIAELVDYEGVGTVEFLYDNKDNFYFMEMNTRIQVEHPVTEMITGVDLLKEQIKAAMGEPLSFEQEDIVKRGHAIELRLNAEDPDHNFTPSAGMIRKLNLPSYPFARIDTFLSTNYEPSSYYDSLIAKIIVWGPTREETLKRMASLLCEVDVSGLITNQNYLTRILAHPDFVANKIDTNFIEKHKEALSCDPRELETEEESLNFAAVASFLAASPNHLIYKDIKDEKNRWKETSRQLSE